MHLGLYQEPKIRREKCLSWESKVFYAKMSPQASSVQSKSHEKVLGRMKSRSLHIQTLKIHPSHSEQGTSKGEKTM